MQACPTGALMPATMVDENNVYLGKPDRTVDSVCPYCGVGCQLTYQIKDDKIVAVTGKNGPANQNRLCVKGRFGFDYVANPQRLLKPMIRKDGVPKVPHELIDPSNPWTHFREATWEEALDRAAGGLKKIRDRDGPDALAGFGSAKGSNEEAYLFQKLVRTGFGTNNVDHCTRLCHASSVSALLEGVGSAAVTATFNECKNSEVIIVIGANPTENHPVAATFFKQAAKRGAKLVVMDPRGTAMKRHAWKMMQFKNGTDVAMLNAMLNVIVTEKLYDQQYIQTYVEGFEALEGERQGLHAGGDGADLRHRGRYLARGRARLRPRRKRDHLLGHGRVAAHPRHRQRALPDRAGADHRPDRPSRHGAASAARPEQRAGRLRRRPHSDVLPRLQVGREPGNPRPVRGRHGASSCRPKRGKTVVEIMDAVHADEIKGMYIEGENPAMSDPDLNHAREALAHLEHLVVQDLFLTETAVYADVDPAGVGLAGEGRHRHQHQPSGADGPPGAAAAGRHAPRSGGSSRRSPTAWAAAGTTSTSARCSPRWRR